MTTALNIGVTALTAHQSAMNVTSHNIANAATPGFSRQRADLSTLEPASVKPGQLGRGVQVDSITRAYDELIVNRLYSSTSEQGRLEYIATALKDAELVFNEPSDAGFSAAIDAAFVALEDLANNPELSAMRAGAIQNLRTFTSTLNSVADNLFEQRAGLTSLMAGEIAEANGIIEQIAELNFQIQGETAAGRNPNDLLDTRERLVTDLSRFLDLTIRTNRVTNAIEIGLDGALLISSGRALSLAAQTDESGAPQLIIDGSRELIRNPGGRIGSVVELGRDILPDIISGMDELAVGMMAEWNRIHSTATSHLTPQNSFIGETIIATSLLDTNLDDDALLGSVGSRAGITAAVQPMFTNPNTGLSQMANLTFNVVDEITGVAEKFIMQYDPIDTVFPAGRSLNDLVSAINTGRGGGFTVYPPRPGGVTGIEAQLVFVDGGVRLDLNADDGKLIDFAAAMDTRPADQAWTNPAVTVTGTDATLANQRLWFRVNGANLEAYTVDGNGLETAYGAPVAITAVGGPFAIGAFSVSFADEAVEYNNGDQFATDIDQFGAQRSGASLTIDQQWSTANAGFEVKGRYLGGHSYDPNRPWRMRVLQSGTIGSATTPPVIELTVYEGDDANRIINQRAVVLDDDFPAGSQIDLADGLYVTFDRGSLVADGSGVDIIVDGQPDSAGVLAGLGMNTLMSGTGARDLSISNRLIDNPELLATAQTRSPGDNSAITELAAMRRNNIFGNNTVQIDGFYQALISEIGVRVQQNETLASNQELVTRSLANRRDSVSGVNIDEEVGLLIIQQQAYTAAARIVTIARENIDTLMELFR